MEGVPPSFMEHEMERMEEEAPAGTTQPRNLAVVPRLLHDREESAALLSIGCRSLDYHSRESFENHFFWYSRYGVRPRRASRRPRHSPAGTIPVQNGYLPQSAVSGQDRDVSVSRLYQPTY
jgi:hypothetical protein